MGELLAMIIMPPMVGVVTYVVLHLLWKKKKRKQIGSNSSTNSM